MGFFDSDEDSSPGSDAVQQQIAQNQEQLEEKRKSLYSQRLDIIRTQGGQNWTPQKPTVAPTPKMPFAFPWGKMPAYGGILDTALGQNRGGVIGKQPTVS